MTSRLLHPIRLSVVVATLAACQPEDQEVRLDGGLCVDGPATTTRDSGNIGSDGLDAGAERKDAGTEAKDGGGASEDGGRGEAPFACPSRFEGDLWAFTNRAAGERDLLMFNHLAVRRIDGFEQLFNVLGFRVNPFPSSGTTAKLLEEGHRPRVIRFTVPDPFPVSQPPTPALIQRFVFVGWPNGWGTGIDAYITVSTCPGDLRVPRRGQVGLPSDPTFAEGCRNWRERSWDRGIEAAQGDLLYELGAQGDVSSATRCVLVPGRTYFLNVYMAIPRSDQTLPRIDGPASSMCFSSGLGESFDCGHGFSVQ